MSKQVNFFLFPEDIEEMYESFKGSINAILISGNSVKKNVVIVDSLTSLTQMNSAELYLCQREALNDIVWDEVEGQGFYIDTFRSPVVEFSKCHYDGTQLRRGRLYFQTGYYDENDVYVNKPKDFVSWANKLLLWVKKKHNKDPILQEYVSAQVQEWVSKGGRLIPN